MSKVTVKGPHMNAGGGTTWDVSCDGLAFAVEFSRTTIPEERERGDWACDVTAADRTTQARLGASKLAAFQAASKAWTTGPLAAIDWRTVEAELARARAF